MNKGQQTLACQGRPKGRPRRRRGALMNRQQLFRLVAILAVAEVAVRLGLLAWLLAPEPAEQLVAASTVDRQRHEGCPELFYAVWLVPPGPCE
jgi:hypothetical protein